MLTRGQQLGKYKIISAIGSGGMGEVFLAEDVELERQAALKILPSEAEHKADRIHRFIREAKAASALNHPNILTIYEIGLVDGIRFIASEYIKGKTLRDRIKSGRIGLSEMLEIALQITSALQTAHSTNIVHRDLKPENIMLREDNLVKVLDFGLAKLTEQKASTFSSESPTREQVKTKPGMVMGTVAYMSPEQARGKNVDERTDIFSLGIVFYEMLTGVPPFSGETNSDVIAEILLKEPPGLRRLNPEVPPKLEEVINKALAKNPDDRYQKTGDLLKDLSEIKQEIDFNVISGGSERNEFLEAKTGLFEGHTDDARVFDTDSIAGSPTNHSSHLKLTEKLKTAQIPYRPLFLTLGLFLVSLSGYTFLTIFTKVPPKTEAVRMFNVGTEALRDGTYNKASKLLEDAVNADNNFPRARAALAEAWMELDYFGRAQAEILKVIELERQNQTFLSGLYQSEDSLYVEAISATVRRDFPKAVRIYERLADKHPSDAYAYVDLGRALERNENIDRAIECFQKATEINPQYGAAFLRLGVLHSRKTEYQKSLEEFQKAETIYDRENNDEGVAEVQYQRGTSFNAQENLTAARAQFEAVISNPRASKYQQIRSMFQISSACSSEGKTDCAEDFASRGIGLAKDERMENVATNGLIDLGNSFLARGDYLKAEQNFQQALSFARKDEGPRNEARALLALGSLRIQQKRPAEAKELVDQVTPFFQKGSYNKEISIAYLILGRASEMNENYAEALKSFEQVENSESASPADKAYAKMVGGNVLMKQQKYADALARFEQSNEIYRSLNNTFYSTHIQFYLSDALLQIGRFDEAKEKLLNAEGILEKGHSLIPTLRTKIQLLDAQIALIRRDLAGAIKASEQIAASKDSEEFIRSRLILGLAQTRLNPKDPKAVQNCRAALQAAENSKDPIIINEAKLALAEAYLNAGNFKTSADNSLAAKDHFQERNQLEATWRALVLMAEAAKLSGSREDARALAAGALESLSGFEKVLGPENYKTYFDRPDISMFFKQAEILSQS